MLLSRLLQGSKRRPGVSMMSNEQNLSSFPLSDSLRQKVATYGDISEHMAR